MFAGKKKYYTLITLLRSAVNVYFGQFLVFYFFTVANYDIVPIATFYIFEYLFLGIGFFLIRHSMKSENGIPYYRIGIALTALYLALIMIFKENIIHYAALVGIVIGMAEGFYHFPNNTLFARIVPNEERKKYSGTHSIFTNVIAITLPLIVGYFLTYFSYVEIAKVVFCLMIISFFLSFGLKDKKYEQKKSDIKGFLQLVKQNRNLKKIFSASFLAGLTFSSGALSLVVTIFTIFEFQTNLNLGIITSIFAVCTCITCYIFGSKLKEKHFRTVVLISMSIFVLSLICFGLFPGKATIILYNFGKTICLTIMTLIFDLYVVNNSNMDEVRDEYQTEYFLVTDLSYCAARVPSYLIVLGIVSIFGIGALKYSFFFFALAIFGFGIILISMTEKRKKR